MLLGLGLSVKNGLKGWFNIYVGREEHWDDVLWSITWPALLVGLLLLVVRVWRKPLPPGFDGDVFPHAYGLVWLVLITQNLIAQLVTGPHSNWSEMAFSLYYVLLFLITAVVVHHYDCLRRQRAAPVAVAGPLGHQ